MEKVRKISKRYYFRQIAACWLVSCMLFALPVQVAMAIENPAAGALPGGLINAIGANDPVVVGNNMGITQTANKAIMNWTNFDIGSDAAVEFIQPSSVAAVLNRVHDGDVTGIMGDLIANGRVFVVNPAGVIFGSSASVNVAQLVASSLDIANGDFIAGNYEFLVGDGVGEVINDGTITAGEGVALLGQRVVNTGTITTTNPDGFVVMAAGDRIVLGEPGSSVIVEMSSATGSIDGDGEVINSDTGTISSPGGTVVLAAGDIFSAALGDDAKAAKVNVGNGTVQQNGTISASAATGDGGTVSLTSGDVTVLGSTSETTANAGTNGNGGQVVVYSPGSAIFEDGARVEAKGGSESGDGGFFELSGKQYVQIEGDIDLTATNGESGMFLIDPYNLTIVDVDPDVGTEPEDVDYSDGLWEPTGESSELDVDILEDYLDTADVTLSTEEDPYVFGTQNGDITFAAGTADARRFVTSSSDFDLTVIAAGDIIFNPGNGIDFSEGTGSVILRNAYDNGGITFADTDTDSVSTTIGDIFMVAGSGDMDIGNLLTNSSTAENATNPGKIRLFTVNGGDITTGRLEVSGGHEVEVSVIASGDLTINGGLSTMTHTVPVADYGKAGICLVAGEDVDITGEVKVVAHGKLHTDAHIHIDAGETVTINVENREVYAKAETSGQGAGDGYVTADATVKIHAGAADDGQGGEAINIFGNKDPVHVRAKIKSNPPTEFKSTGDAGSGDNQNSVDAVYDSEDNLINGSHAQIEIEVDYDFAECPDCPPPPLLPPVPFFIEIEDDQITYSWSVVSEFTDVLENDAGYTSPSEPIRLVDGTIIWYDPYTTKGVELEIMTIDDPENPGSSIMGFLYTPPEGEDFDWDGDPTHPATFTDTFTYRAEDAEGNPSTLATVTITVTNFLPTALGDSETIHMRTAANTTNADFDLTTLITDPDGTPGTLTLAKGDNDVVFGVASVDDSTDTATYEPFEGYVGNDDFDYTVTDSTINYQGEPVTSATLEVTVTNELPSGDGWLGVTEMDTSKSTGFIEGGFADNDDDDVSILGSPFDGAEYLTGDPTSDYGGDLTYDGDNSEDKPQWTYTPDTDNLPGYTGDDKDTWGDGDYWADEQFTVDLWDGQNEYQLAGSTAPEPGDGEIWTAVGPSGEDTLWVRPVYGEGTVSVDLESGAELSGDAYFGPVHMDTTVSKVGLTSDDGTGNYEGALNSSNFIDGSYSGDDRTGPLGGSLVLDDGTWTYTPDPLLEGYTGNTDDEWSTNPATYNLDTDPDEKFTVDLTTGEHTYIIDKGAQEGEGFLVFEDDVPLVEYVAYKGTVTVELTNEAPTVTDSSTTLHMDDGITNQNLAADNPDTAVDPAILDVITLYNESGGELGDGDTFELDSGTVTVNVVDGTYFFSFEPKEGYVGGPETFTVKVSDQEYTYLFGLGTVPEGFELYIPGTSEDPPIYRKKVVDEGTVEITMTNNKPSAYGNLGEATDPVLQIGTTTPVLVTDEWDPQQKDIDDLSIIPGIYDGDSGGKLEFRKIDKEWVWFYTPADGFTGTETFQIKVWDGQNDYSNPEEPVPDYGVGTVIVSTTPEVTIPPAPLVRELIEYSGCPVLLQAAATELGTTAETIQISIAQAMATAPNIQPCDACANLVNYAVVLRDTEGAYLEALAQVVNEFTSIDAPPSEEEMASIADAIARHTDDGTHYAAAGQYLDALAQYVGLLNDNFGYPVVDSVAFAADKYVGPLAEKTDNVAVSTYVASRLGAIAGQ